MCLSNPIKQRSQFKIYQLLQPLFFFSRKSFMWLYMHFCMLARMIVAKMAIFSSRRKEPSQRHYRGDCAPEEPTSLSLCLLTVGSLFLFYASLFFIKLWPWRYLGFYLAGWCGKKSWLTITNGSGWSMEISNLAPCHIAVYHLYVLVYIGFKWQSKFFPNSKHRQASQCSIKISLNTEQCDVFLAIKVCLS